MVPLKLFSFYQFCRRFSFSFQKIAFGNNLKAIFEVGIVFLLSYTKNIFLNQNYNKIKKKCQVFFANLTKSGISSGPKSFFKDPFWQAFSEKSFTESGFTAPPVIKTGTGSLEWAFNMQGVEWSAVTQIIEADKSK